MIVIWWVRLTQPAFHSMDHACVCMEKSLHLRCIFRFVPTVTQLNLLCFVSFAHHSSQFLLPIWRLSLYNNNIIHVVLVDWLKCMLSTKHDHGRLNEFEIHFACILSAYMRTHSTQLMSRIYLYIYNHILSLRIKWKSIAQITLWHQIHYVIMYTHDMPILAG